ncbi:MAG: hypothetical protein GX087_08880 [Desulfobulbaceae bacterium]|nr:hypothetical protein [Desulfobulbaceae bacterium]
MAYAVHRLHGKKPGSFYPGFNRYQYRPFAVCAPATFTGTLATHKGIIEFNQIGKSVDAVTMGHGLTDFTQHAAGCGPGDAQVFGCPQGGDSAFIRSHEVNGPEPFDQGYLGGMKQGSGSYGDLMPAACALVEPARGDEVCFCGTACRTLKTVWPSHFNQRLGASLFRAESFLPLYQTEYWHSHGKTSRLKYQYDLAYKYRHQAEDC